MAVLSVFFFSIFDHIAPLSIPRILFRVQAAPVPAKKAKKPAQEEDEEDEEEEEEEEEEEDEESE